MALIYVGCAWSDAITPLPTFSDSSRFHPDSVLLFLLVDLRFHQIYVLIYVLLRQSLKDHRDSVDSVSFELFNLGANGSLIKCVRSSFPPILLTK